MDWLGNSYTASDCCVVFKGMIMHVRTGCLRIFLLTLPAIILASCSLPPSEELNRTLQTSFRADIYTVQSGDTLYSIAWRYQMDHKNLIRWNNLSPPYQLISGQKLVIQRQNNVIVDKVEPQKPKQNVTQVSVSTNPSAKTSGLRTTRSKIIAQPIGSLPKADNNLTKKVEIKEKPVRNHSSAKNENLYRRTKKGWQWPSEGRLLKQVSEYSVDKKVIQIEGITGQSIRAAASGEVVYSGEMPKQGHLLIIKHNKTFISSYANNSELLVSEGDSVAVGQKIALMGRGQKGKPILKFGIRLDGKPVDPLKYLPER